jgi:hypothetical protein
MHTRDARYSAAPARPAARRRRRPRPGPPAPAAPRPRPRAGFFLSSALKNVHLQKRALRPTRVVFVIKNVIREWL